MALYRCAACGSPNVVTDTQAGGISYNYKKGAIGTVVLGVGGAAAGIENRTQTVYKCSDCGMVLSYPMDAETKAVIDLGVTSAEARERLTVYDIGISWDFLKKKYKNIEYGLADELIRIDKEFAAKERKDTVDFLAEHVKKKISDLIADVAAYNKGIYNFEELQQAWEQASKAVLANREKALVEAENALNIGVQQQYDQAYAATVDKTAPLEAEKKTLTDEYNILAEKLPTLGIFKIKEKKETQSRIKEIDGKLDILNNKISLINTGYKKEIETIQKAYLNKKDQISREVVDKYPLEENPIVQKAKLDYFRTSFEKIKTEKLNTVIHRELQNLFVYCLLDVMQEFSDEKGIYVSENIETKWDGGNFNLDDAEPIFKKIAPHLLVMLNCESVELADMVKRSAFRPTHFLARLRKGLVEEARIVECYEMGLKRLYVVK